MTLAPPAAAEEAPAEPAVHVRSVESGRLVDVTLPGTLLHVADACTARECRGLLLLAKSADRRKVFFFEPGEATAPVELEADLPPRADALAVVDVDGDGTADILAGEPGRLYHLGTLGERPRLREGRLLVESRGLALAKLDEGGFLRPGRIVVPGLRSLDVFTTDGEGVARLDRSLPLPHRARLEPTGLNLYTYPVTRLELDGRTLYAVGPEPHGNRRLRTVLIAPDSDSGAETEAWSWLPAPETVVAAWYVSMNGRPALVVTTVQADRIGFFEKKKLRVFPLTAGDRSRAGSTPSLAAQTASHHWQDADPDFTDADGDGKVDLVLVQPEGFGGKKLVVEAYRGLSYARFHPVPLRSVVPARRADAWSYGADVDGDGTGDLVTCSGEIVQVFRGLGDSKKKQVLEKKPHWRIDLETGTPAAESEEDGDGAWEGRNHRNRLAVRDVDRDGKAEILVRSNRDGTSVLRIVDP